MAEINILQQHFPSLGAFRSSEALRAAAEGLLAQAVLLPVKRRVHNNYEMSARVEALLDFVVAACCIPHVFALLGEGSKPVPKRQDEHTQQSSYDASQAMLQECLQYFKDAHQEYLAQGGSDQQLDEHRTELVVQVLSYRRVPWVVSFARTIASHLPALLGTMSRHLLVVVNLCGEVTRKIDEVTAAIRRKVASSSQENEERAKEDPLVVVEAHVAEYWAWLREHRTRLVPICRVTELVTSLDPALRNSLQAEHYTSPEQFLDVFNNRYRTTLKHLPVPLLEWTHSDYDQALKDINREHVILNKQRLEGGQLRQQLYDAMQPLVQSYLFGLYNHYTVAHTGGNATASASNASSHPTSTIYLPELMKEAAELTWRVVDHIIVISARTVACGDMLLLLQDLFGGEGLVLTPQGKESIDVNIQVNDIGEILVEAAERFHLVEADQMHLQGKQQMDVLMTFRTSATTCVELHKCPRCKGEVTMQTITPDEGEDELKPDQVNTASTTKSANGQKRVLQQACSDVFEHIASLSQRHMNILPLLPVVLQSNDDDSYDV